MRVHVVAGCLFVVLAIAQTLPCSADILPLPTPTPFSGPETYCPVAVAELEPLDADKSGAAITYALALRSDKLQREASGTVAFYIGNDRYSARFHDVQAYDSLQSPNSATPIVVTFSVPVQIDSAYVASLDTPMLWACTPNSPWDKHLVSSFAAEQAEDGTENFNEALFRTTAQTLPAVTATFTQRERDPSCETPDQLPSVSQIAADYPRSAFKRHARGEAKVAVTLDPAGSLLAASVYKSTGDTELDNAAVAAALGATYVPGTFRCEPAFGTYLITVSFGRR